MIRGGLAPGGGEVTASGSVIAWGERPRRTAGFLRVWPGRSLAVWLSVGLLLAAAVVVVFDGLGPSAGRDVSVGHVRSRGLGALPALARGPVSAALGRADRAYGVVGLRAFNPAQRFGVRFGRAGVALRSESGRLSLRLAAFGRVGALRGVERAVPRASANRVSYGRGGISEWYVNGPLGLEQGFDVTARPPGGGALALAVAVSPGVSVRLSRAGALLTGGGVSVRYTGLSASDSSGRPLAAWLAVVGGRLELRVDDRGARYPLRIDPFVQQAMLVPGDTVGHNSEEGASVALSADGNTALVGGPGDDPCCAQVPTDFGGLGAAWVFTRSGSTWTEQAKLVGSGAVGHSGQGSGVALSADGNTALIGGAADNNFAGAAWVFTRSGSTWTQQGSKLVGKGAAGAAEQGDSVALSADGNTALVGGHVDNGGVGAAWVFTRSGSAWAQQGSKLVGNGPVGNSFQGWSVALSADGTTALIGGPNDDNTYGFGPVGAAWVFTRSGSTWTQQGPKLIGSGASGQTFEGSSVALSADGNTALIGGPEDDNNVGATWVFTRSGSTWTQQGSKLVGNGAAGVAHQGVVALSADAGTALIGGPANGIGKVGNSGEAWVFTLVASSGTPTPGLSPQAPSLPVASSPMPAPAISGLGVSPRKFSIAGRKVRRECVKPTKRNQHNKPCRRPIRLKVTYTLNQAATVTFKFTRWTPGRKVRGKCVQQTKNNKHKKLCWRYVPIHGSFVKVAKAGGNAFTFNGWIGRYRLAPGAYQLIATPSSGSSRTVTFRIAS